MANHESPESVLPRPLPPQPLIERLGELAEEWRRRVSWLPIVALAVVSFGVTWWVTRPAPVAPELPDYALPVATPPPTPTVVPALFVVHVAGAVEAPGVISVLQGARVVDVVELAGGLAADADLAEVNLAGLVGDGQRLWIPRHGEPEPVVSVGNSPPPSPSSGAPAENSGGVSVDVNVATPAELETLPGIGPAIAAAIIDHRERNGPFGAIDDLLEVAGIGPAKLDAIRSSVKV